MIESRAAACARRHGERDVARLEEDERATLEHGVALGDEDRRTTPPAGASIDVLHLHRLMTSSA